MDEEKEVHDYILTKDGDYVNTIVADEEFIKQYAKDMGYEYEMRPDPEPDPTPSGPTEAPLTEKLSAMEERQEFLEDCIAEMALQVYS